MGGLWKKIPITAWTFMIATIAIAGFPPFAGFFSKDEILASAFDNPYFHDFGKVIWVIGSLAAFCTAYYMFRLVFLTFFGDFRGTHEQEHHVHESPWTMTVPLIILATLSLLGGALRGCRQHHFLPIWMAPIFAKSRGIARAQ